MSDNKDLIPGNITLNLYGKPVELQMDVPAKPVKARAMLPIFAEMSNTFIEFGEKMVEAEGKKVSCQKGCNACCYQAVPLAESEVYQIAELVENFPEPKRSEIRQKFADSCAKIREINWFNEMENYGELSLQDRQTLVLRYYSQNLACPFLEEGLCLIHESRPLGCREYLVTSPAINCLRPSAQTVRLLEIPIKLSENFRLLATTENRTKLNFVTLIKALEFAEKFPENEMKKTGPEWMGEIFQHIFGKNLNETQSTE